MTLANGFATTLMVVACSTAAAQTLVGTPSDATGIDGLVFDGKTYNVTFESGTFQSVFPGGLINGFGRGNDAGLADAMTQLSRRVKTVDELASRRATTKNAALP